MRLQASSHHDAFIISLFSNMPFFQKRKTKIVNMISNLNGRKITVPGHSRQNNGKDSDRSLLQEAF